MNTNDIKKNIMEYLINEFEYTENEAREELKNNIVDLATGYLDSQASFDVQAKVLILDCGDIIKYIPVNDINYYLDYELLSSLLDNVLEIQGLI